MISAPPICLSLPAIRCLSSVTIPSNRAEVLDDERIDLVACCIFDGLSLTPFLPYIPLSLVQESVGWVKRPRDKRLAFGAENCVRYSLIVRLFLLFSSLFLFVSIHGV